MSFARRTWPGLRAVAIFAALAAAASRAASPVTLVSANASNTPGLFSAASPPNFAASTTAAAHRIPLPPGPPVHLRLSVLESTIEVLTASGAPLKARLPLLSTPCRPVNPLSDELVLHCSTGRLDAAIVESKGRRYLDLRELRGIPTNDGEEGPPLFDYPPDQVGLGKACPGDTEAARGECFFELGQNEKAQVLLASALKKEETRNFAALRLGDLALRRRDPNRALAIYAMAGDEGPWGRLATERICELTGLCLREAGLPVYDPVALPPAMADELAMRQVRALALLGRWSEAMERLATMLDASPAICMGQTKMLCRRLTLAALHTPDCPREAALSTYLRLPLFLTGPLAAELARAAGEDSSELGAPEYGATLLSATARLADRRDLLAHARETIALYQAAHDPIRAHVMWSWANTRLTPTEARLLQADGDGGPASPPSRVELLSANLATDESASTLAVARSILLRARLAAPPGRSSRKR